MFWEFADGAVGGQVVEGGQGRVEEGMGGVGVGVLDAGGGVVFTARIYWSIFALEEKGDSVLFVGRRTLRSSGFPAPQSSWLALCFV